MKNLSWIFCIVYSFISLPIAHAEFMNGFESPSDLANWYLFNNCSPGSSAYEQYFFSGSARFEGTQALRLQTQSFTPNCQYPGMYALSPAYSIHSGQSVRVGSHVRNGGVLNGRTVLIFYDKSGNEMSSKPGGYNYVDWPTAGPWDWPNWHQPNTVVGRAPDQAGSFRVRYELHQANAIVDIDALEISGHKLKGALFNFQALASNGVNIGDAWQDWLSVDPQVYASAAHELDLLLAKTHVNLLYIMVSSGQIGWPATNINPNSFWSLATFLNLARSRGVQVGISLNTHCLVSNGYANTAGLQNQHMGANGTWSGCSDKNIEDAKAWYASVISRVESILGANKDAIAFWEMSGNPQFGASEIPMWNSSPWILDRYNSLNGKTYPGIASFVRQAWPHFKSLTTRPTAITILPVSASPSSPPTDISALTNFQYWIPWWETQGQPDYFIFTSSPTLPIDNILDLRSHLLGDVPAKKIILGDFKWQQLSHDPVYNPSQLSAPDIVNGQFSLVRNKGLAGWWVWAFRDQVSGPSDPTWALTEGLLDLFNQWKMPLTNVFVNETKWPYE